MVEVAEWRWEGGALVAAAVVEVGMEAVAMAAVTVVMVGGRTDERRRWGGWGGRELAAGR